jgi:hypothetical protein
MELPGDLGRCAARAKRDGDVGVPRALKRLEFYMKYAYSAVSTPMSMRTMRVAAIVFAFLLFAVAQAADDTWSGVERIVAIGDLHGDYDAFISVLRSTGLIDEKDKWTGGKTHLVLTGDVPDRGPDSRKIFDLLFQLEKKAKSDGGYVHTLTGNHEAMNVYGDLRYTSAEEYASFKTGDSTQLRDAFYKQHLEETRQAASPGDAYRKEWETKYPLGYVEHRIQFGPDGKYGQRIRKQNAIVKINDVLFMHAGLSPKYASYSIRDINERIRKELSDFRKLEGGFTLDDKDGPLWYRGLAQDDSPELRAHVDALLKTHGVSRIVIGHTPTGGAVLPRLDGKVVVIDVGLSRVYGGPPSGLVIETGVAYVVHRGQRIDLPGPSGTEILAYLKKVAALEPEGSPVRKHVADVEAQLRPLATR